MKLFFVIDDGTGGEEEGGGEVRGLTAGVRVEGDAWGLRVAGKRPAWLRTVGRQRLVSLNLQCSHGLSFRKANLGRARKILVVLHRKLSTGKFPELPESFGKTL